MAYTYAIRVAVMFRCADQYVHVPLLHTCIVRALCKETWHTLMSCAVTKFHANILSLREHSAVFMGGEGTLAESHCSRVIVNSCRDICYGVSVQAVHWR